MIFFLLHIQYNEHKELFGTEKEKKSFIISYATNIKFIFTAHFYFPVCKDNWLKCPEWAGKGECIKNKDWMLKNCQKSCHVCGKFVFFQVLQSQDIYFLNLASFFPFFLSLFHPSPFLLLCSMSNNPRPHY